MRSKFSNDCRSVHNAGSLNEIKSLDQPGSPISIFAFTTKRHFPALLSAILLAAVAGALRPVVAIFLGYIFDELLNFGAGNSTASDLLHAVSTWTIGLAGIGVATLLANGAFFSLWLVFGEMQARSAREVAFVSMLEKEIEWYDLRTDGVGSVLTRIQTQVRELQTACSQPLGFAIEVTAAALASLGVAFYYSWDLTLIIMACIPITIVILSFMTRTLQPAIEHQKINLNIASRFSYSAIKAADVVKVFNAQDHEVWQYTSSVRKAAEFYMVQAHVNSLQIGITRFITIAIFMVGFWYGMFLVKQGFNPGRLLTTFYSCLMATQAAEQLLPQWLVLTRGMSAGKSLRDIVMQKQPNNGMSGLKSSLIPTKCSGDVEVSNLTFYYPSAPGRPALNNASFFFPAGETIFVVGKSGSGKSTLGNLLLGFYEPASGNLLIDGIPLHSLNMEWLRSNISLVQQESILFNDTVFRNISIGLWEHVSEADVKMACQTAMLQDTINDLPDGLNTVVGSGGRCLSGGQRQRVVIARARLRDSPILLLDEATNALDHNSRSCVIESIRHWRRGKTTVIITHDLSEIMDDDYVYVLDQGEVVQEGYRRHLMKEIHGPFTSIHRQTVYGQPKRSRHEIDQVTLDGTKATESLEQLIPPSVIKATPCNESTELQLRDQSRHVSNIFGFDIGISQQSRPTSRIAHVSTPKSRTQNAWEDPNSPSISQPYQISLNKPLPALPTFRNSWRFQDNYQPSFNIEPENVGSLYLRAHVAKMSRKGINRRHSSGEHHLSNAKPAFNISTLLTCRGVSERNVKDLHRTPSSYKTPAALPYIFATIWPVLLWKDRLKLIFGFVSAIISASSTPAFSYVLAKLLGTFVVATDQSRVAEKWALCILSIAVVDGISTYFMHYLLEYCGEKWVDHFRVQALARILNQPQAWFDMDKNSPGYLNECLDRNAEEMRNLVGRFAGIVVLAASMMSIAIIWASIVCWKLTLIGLAGGPLMYMFTRAFEAVSARWEKRINEMDENIGGVFFEAFSNIRVVRALTLETYFQEKHRKAARQAYRVGTRRAAYTGVLFGASDSTNTFVTALVLYYAALVAASGDVSVQNVLLVINLLLFSSGNLNSAVAFIPQISSSCTTATCLLHLANMPKQASYESTGTKYLESPLPIKFNSLSFAYPNRPMNEVLHKISMIFEANTCTAIVGPSGSGKSTLVSLILGLYSPNEPLHHPYASLTFAGTSIFSTNIPSLRGQIAFVSQHTVVFPLTIAENITYGLRITSALRSQYNVIAAARGAGVHDFIMSLPCAYETRIGDGGQGLSGGQAQRIAIARALVRRPKVLILDEPSAALDMENARVIRDTIERLVRRSTDMPSDDCDVSASCGMSKEELSGMRWGMEWERKEMAVILITHSAEMMKVADKIIMLEHGQVVEQGRFEELFRGRGSFWKMVSGKS